MDANDSQVKKAPVAKDSQVKKATDSLQKENEKLQAKKKGKRKRGGRFTLCNQEISKEIRKADYNVSPVGILIYSHD